MSEANEGKTGRILWGVGTSRTIRPHWALHELGLSYEVKPIGPRSGETLTQEYTALTARQKIPLLQDQGLVMIGVHSPEFAYERDIGNGARGEPLTPPQ